MKTRIFSKTVGSFITAMLVAFAASSPHAKAAERSIELTQDADYFGFDLRTVKGVSLNECESECIADTECAAFTYNPKVSWCFLKSDFRDLNESVGAIAGKVVIANSTSIASNEPDLGAAPSLPYLSPTVVSEARRYFQKMQADKSGDVLTEQEALAAADTLLLNGDPRQAANYLVTALVLNPENQIAWYRLAEANRQVSGSNHAEELSQKSNATSAAWFAYDTSRHREQRAAALSLLAETLDAQDLSKEALRAYRDSLELVASPSVKESYIDLRARKGFRIIGQDVQNDATSASICVKFSSHLVKRDVDYAMFLKVDNAVPKAVEAKEQQLCVTGLEHGRSYHLAVREGLPSADGEALSSPASFDLYMKDRPASMRFTGDSFVLPSKGRRGIPIVSVNATVADLKLYRIGDRAIAQMLSGSIFRRQLDNYDLSQVSDQLGTPVWQGKVDLAKAEQNKEAVTSIPVHDVINERKAGVYVLVAEDQTALSESYAAKATQWFVISDIGLTTYTGKDGITVFTRSLSTAEALDDVELTLLAKNNEVLGVATSDGEGKATFSSDLAQKSGGMTPAAIIARGSDDEDFVFLDLSVAGFDLSDRGVTGRAAPEQLDVFTWTERGIYRPGETVHVGALARDISADAVEKLPLTFLFSRPDGVEDRRIVVNSEALGGYSLSLELPANAMRGTWSLAVYTDPKLEPISSQMFLVEDFVPDRLEFDLTSSANEVAVGGDVYVSVDGRYLYGAPAAGLAIEADLVLTTKRQWDRYKGYYFGLAEEEDGQAFRTSVADVPRLDANGKARFPVSITQVPSSTRPINAALSVRLQETGGRAVERKLDLFVRPAGDLIGIRPEFSGDEVQQGSAATFSVIAATNEGGRKALSGAKWTLEKIERNYQWYRDGNSWNYEPVTFTRMVTSGSVDISLDADAKVTVPTEWGRYRLTIETSDPDGPITSYEFDSGWYVSATSTETPDGLEIALDKENYAVGETAQLKISPRFAGELLVTVGAEQLFETMSVSVPADGTVVEIPVKKEWGAGAYVTATLFRPGDDSESRMPMRAIGLKWLKVDPAEKALKIALNAPEMIQPNSVLSIPVQVENATGEQAFVTLAAVDVGILNLTRYQAPNPGEWFFGQRKLGLEIRDLYGRMIDGSLGATGTVRTGGDGANMSSEGSPPTEKLVAFFSGPVELDSDGNATIEFSIPQFNGTARLMAVAWTKSAIGQSTQDVVIRDPIVVAPNLPRFLTPGDVADISFDFTATDAQSGQYSISIDASEHLMVAAQDASREIGLEKGLRQTIRLPLTAEKIGDAKITVRVTNSDGINITQNLMLPIIPLDQPVTRQHKFELAANGGSATIDQGIITDQRIDGASVNINVSNSSAFDTGALLLGLDLYPYGCTEQTTSRALPMLYVNELSGALSNGLETKEVEVKSRVQQAIYKVINNQTSSGSYGLWSPSSSGGLWLDSFVTDFLTRSREMGYDVPQVALTNSLMNLQNSLGYITDVRESGSEIAYALYVLSRNKKASLGDLRYYADSQLSLFDSPFAVAQLGASLAYYGDQARTERLFKIATEKLSSPISETTSRNDYGTPLRDAAGVLALAAEVKPVAQVTPELIQAVASQRNKAKYLSTQDQMWMVLAARALKQQDANITLSMNEVEHSGAFSQTFTGGALQTNMIHLENRGDTPLEGVVTVVASPNQSLPASGNGFDITREYYSLDGELVNISSAQQNQRYVVVLKVNEQSDARSNILVSDFIPAGFEIDNPSLVSSAELSNFSWLERTEAAHLEFRNDRFVAAFERGAGNKAQIVLAYVVRAVTPGLFSHPAAIVENMYRPQFSARTSTSMMEVAAP